MPGPPNPELWAGPDPQRLTAVRWRCAGSNLSKWTGGGGTCAV